MFESRHKLQLQTPQNPLKCVVFEGFSFYYFNISNLSKTAISAQKLAYMGVKMGVKIFVLYCFAGNFDLLYIHKNIRMFLCNHTNITDIVF